MKSILFTLMLALSASTWATGKPDPKPDPKPQPQNPTTILNGSASNSEANAAAGAAAGAVSGSWSGSNATGGAGGNSNATGGNSSAAGGAASASIGDMTASGGMGGAGGLGGSSSLNDQSRSNTYVFPAPVSAAPLPGTICPKGDSISWSIGWNFFSYARSSTRTELECLERYAELFKAKNAQQAPVMPSMYVIPASTIPEAKLNDTTPEPLPVQPVADVKPAVAPKKAPAKKPAASKPLLVEPNCGQGEVLSCQPKKTPLIKTN